MAIRNATYHDADFIKGLLNELGYGANLSLLVDQLERFFGNDDHQAYVYELSKEVVGFVTVHYLPQLAFNGGVAIISYLSARENVRGIDVAAELERYLTEQAQSRNCELIQVHCMDWRTPVHQFYLKLGYKEYPKYFSKRLVYGEELVQKSLARDQG